MSAGAKYVMIDGIKPVIFTGLSHDAFKSLGEITSAGAGDNTLQSEAIEEGK